MVQVPGKVAGPCAGLFAVAYADVCRVASRQPATLIQGAALAPKRTGEEC